MSEDNYDDLSIDDIAVLASTNGMARVQLQWSSVANGFGNCYITLHEDGATTIDSEFMSAGFVKALLCKVVDKYFKAE